MSENSEFGLLRSELLKLFLRGEHIGEAGLLGAQFHDFDTLIKTYKIEKDETKLTNYLKLERFPDYLFSKYRGEPLVEIAAQHGGQIAEIVSQDRSLNY